MLRPICEVLSDDGSPARFPHLERFAAEDDIAQPVYFPDFGLCGDELAECAGRLIENRGSGSAN
jgi:hypothetical protein